MRWPRERELLERQNSTRRDRTGREVQIRAIVFQTLAGVTNTNKKAVGRW